MTKKTISKMKQIQRDKKSILETTTPQYKKKGRNLKVKKSTTPKGMKRVYVYCPGEGSSTTKHEEVPSILKETDFNKSLTKTVKSQKQLKTTKPSRDRKADKFEKTHKIDPDHLPTRERENLNLTKKQDKSELSSIKRSRSKNKHLAGIVIFFFYFILL